VCSLIAQRVCPSPAMAQPDVEGGSSPSAAANADGRRSEIEKTTETERNGITQVLKDAYAFVWPVAGVTKTHMGQIHRVWLQQQFTPPFRGTVGLWPKGMVQLENVGSLPYMCYYVSIKLLCRALVVC